MGERFVTRGRTIGEADISAFAALTGDTHPQHTDAEWAADSRFGERIAHGLLVLSYAVGADAVRSRPHRGAAPRWRRRVQAAREIGDTIHVEGEVVGTTELDAGHGLVECRWRVLNQRGKLVLRASVELVWRRGAMPRGRRHRPLASRRAGAGAALTCCSRASGCSSRACSRGARSRTPSAERAQQEGAEVVLTGFGRTRRMTERAAARLPEPPDVLELDVKRGRPRGAVGRARARAGAALDGALHAIAFAPGDALGGNFMSAPPESAEIAFRTSAYSFKALAAAVAPLMGDGGGSLVGMDFDASVAWPVYDWMGVAKAALESVSRYLARDLGPSACA